MIVPPPPLFAALTAAIRPAAPAEQGTFADAEARPAEANPNIETTANKPAVALTTSS